MSMKRSFRSPMPDVEPAPCDARHYPRFSINFIFYREHLPGPGVQGKEPKSEWYTKIALAVSIFGVYLVYIPGGWKHHAKAHGRI
jgi:hypothetical protein